VQFSDGLSNGVSNITGRYIDHMKFAAFIIVYMVVCFVCFCLILKFMYFYCYVYVFFSLCMFFSVYSVFIVPIGTLRLPWLRFSMLFPQL